MESGREDARLGRGGFSGRVWWLDTLDQPQLRICWLHLRHGRIDEIGGSVRVFRAGCKVRDQGDERRRWLVEMPLMQAYEAHALVGREEAESTYAHYFVVYLAW